MDELENIEAAKRVVVIVSTRSPRWQSAWASSEDLIVVALELMQKENLIPPNTTDNHSAIKCLAKERWDSRTLIVFDVFHDTYNPVTAHLPGHNDLPVISVYLGRKESANIAGPLLRNKVNVDIRALHNSTGLGSIPPFSVDHSDGKVPFYRNPELRT